MALKDSFTTFDGTGSTAYGTTWLAQTFTTGSTYTATDVALNCWKYGSPGNITVSIRATSAGKPTGADLCSATVADSEISTLPTLAYYTFTFASSYALDDATVYAIVWRATGGDASNYFQVFGYDSSGYASGGYVTSSDSGSSWGSVSTTRDMNFRTYGTTTLPGKPTTPSPANEASDITLHSTTGTWVSGGNTDSYNIYYGTLSGFLDLVEEGVTDLSLALVDGNFSVYGKISYWRIDAVNVYGTTQGDEWYFTTMNFDQLRISYRLISGGSGAGPYDDPAGTQGTDWEYTGLNNMITVGRLVVAANSKIWYESI